MDRREIQQIRETAERGTSAAWRTVFDLCDEVDRLASVAEGLYAACEDARLLLLPYMQNGHEEYEQERNVYRKLQDALAATACAAGEGRGVSTNQRETL